MKNETTSEMFSHPYSTVHFLNMKSWLRMNSAVDVLDCTVEIMFDIMAVQSSAGGAKKKVDATTC